MLCIWRIESDDLLIASAYSASKRRALSARAAAEAVDAVESPHLDLDLLEDLDDAMECLAVGNGGTNIAVSNSP